MTQTIPIAWRSHIRRALPFLICALLLLTVLYLTVSVLQATKCHICQEMIIGKPERINEAPTCDRCYSEIEFNCKTTRWEER